MNNCSSVQQSTHTEPSEGKRDDLRFSLINTREHATQKCKNKNKCFRFLHLHGIQHYSHISVGEAGDKITSYFMWEIWFVVASECASWDVLCFCRKYEYNDLFLTESGADSGHISFYFHHSCKETALCVIFVQLLSNNCPEIFFTFNSHMKTNQNALYHLISPISKAMLRTADIFWSIDIILLQLLKLFPCILDQRIALFLPVWVTEGHKHDPSSHAIKK